MSNPTSDHTSTQGGYLWVLSLDGGGVRALSSLRILTAIMNRAGREPDQVFTTTIGTSAGGLNALMIGKLGLGLAACEDHFIRLSRRVFRMPAQSGFTIFSSPRYSDTTMEMELRSTIHFASGNDNCMMQAVTSQGSSTTYVVCREVVNTRLIPGYVALGTQPGHGPDCEIWKAGRATSAAPTYFSPQSIDNRTFVDGGMGYNNPINTLKRQGEIFGFGGVDRRRIRYVSIGAGKPTTWQLHLIRNYWRRFKWSVIRIFLRPFRTTTPLGQLAGYLVDKKMWRSLVDKSMEEKRHRRFEEKVAEEDRGVKNRVRRYFRFNCDGDLDFVDDYHLAITDLDGVGDLDRIREVTDQYLKRADGDIRHCAEQLSLPNLGFLP